MTRPELGLTVVLWRWWRSATSSSAASSRSRWSSSSRPTGSSSTSVTASTYLTGSLFAWGNHFRKRNSVPKQLWPFRSMELYNGIVYGVTEEGSGLSVLRTFRLLRILKLVRFLPNLRRQLIVMLKTMDNVAVFFGLLALFIFIFRWTFLSVLGRIPWNLWNISVSWEWISSAVSLWTLRLGSVTGKISTPCSGPQLQSSRYFCSFPTF